MRLRAGSALAFRTIEARALAHDYVFDRRRACVARFSLAAVHAQARGKAPGLSARIAVTAKGRAVAANRGAQDRRHRRRNPFDLDSRHAAGPPRGTHAREEKNLRCVDIADAGDDPLIHYQVLDRRRPAASPRGKIIGVEFARQRLGPETLQLRRGSQRAAPDQTDHAEAAWIVV